MFTIYSAGVTGNPGNCSYPHKHVILDEDSLKAAICHDYVCAEYKNSYRNGDNFIGSDWTGRLVNLMIFLKEILHQKSLWRNV